MSHELKTLIVFDTNTLRTVKGDKVAYSFFSFGKSFQVIEDFIIENKLSDSIHIAVPTWTIEELKDQKKRQYNEDVIQFRKLAERLSGLPHTGEITFPEVEFDCAAYIQQKADEYLTAKRLKLLEIKENIANDALKSMMTRVMKDKQEKAPFAHSGKYKDAGFKDNIVWESLMNYGDVTKYDKVIFVSSDGDFNKHCEDEFEAKWERHIEIQKEENNVIASIKKDYGNYLEFRKFYEYAQKQYFMEYLNQELHDKEYIYVHDEERVIESYKITKNCERVVRRGSSDEDREEDIIIYAEAKIKIMDGGKYAIEIQITMDELFEIYEVNYEPIIY